MEKHAVHKDDALHMIAKARLSSQSKRDIRQGAISNERDFFAGVKAGVDQQFKAVFARLRRPVFAGRERLGLAYGTGERTRDQRLFRAHADRNIGAPKQREDLEDKVGAAGAVLEDRGDAPDVEFGRLERKAERERVVDVVTDVGVEQDGYGSSSGLEAEAGRDEADL